MQIDPRLNDIDDCLYRVAIRALIVKNNKVLLVKEALDNWWAFPGGGVGHGETAEAALIRELEEELGVSASAVSTNLEIAHYSIGSVVNAVPRMNLYFKVSTQEELLKKSSEVERWSWFTKDDFLKVGTHPSYNKDDLVGVIFDD